MRREEGVYKQEMIGGNRKTDKRGKGKEREKLRLPAY